MRKTSRKRCKVEGIQTTKRRAEERAKYKSKLQKEKKEKTPPKTKQKTTHTKKNKKQLLLPYEFEDEDAFFEVGSVLRRVLYMIYRYCLCLHVSVSQVLCFLQVTLTRQCR